MHFYTFVFYHSILNISILPLQGFSIQNLTPNEAAAVLFRAEERMGKAIPEEDLKAGNLKQYLLPEDYQPIKQVSTMFIYLFSGSLLAEASGGLSGPRSVMSRFLTQYAKNTSSLDEDFQPTDQFLQVTAYWCSSYSPRVFTHHFPCLAYAGVRQLTPRGSCRMLAYANDLLSDRLSISDRRSSSSEH